MLDHDTIAAVATSSVNGSISVIRVSGEKAVSLADRILSLRHGNLKSKKSHTVNYGHVIDADGHIIDEVIVLLMRAPNSYTREDVVELQCHGGVFVCREILSLLTEAGARIAEPGEFTKRAFLNGRIDLSQAEAVMNLIESKNKYALESSVSQLNGMIQTKIAALREKIIDDVAFIEAALDDPEHISMDDFSKTFAEHMNVYRKEIDGIINNFKNGRLIKEGIRTVIAGRPNVGKSSFYNAMAGMDRAIVTDIPGTTRDTLEEDVRLGDLSLHLIDTAGIHETKDQVEQIGIERARESIGQADFCILVLDGSNELSEEDIYHIHELSALNGVILLNKNDLNQQTEIEEIERYSDWKVISFSAKTGDGMSELESYLKEQFHMDRLSFNDEIYLTNERQKQAVRDASESLKHVEESMEMGLGEDFYTIDLMNAYESLGSIIGESVDDDLINTIFQKFCMGK